MACTDCVNKRPHATRRQRAICLAPKIPNAKALRLILESFPESERAQLFAEMAPKLRFTPDAL